MLQHSDFCFCLLVRHELAGVLILFLSSWWRGKAYEPGRMLSHKSQSSSHARAHAMVCLLGLVISWVVLRYKSNFQHWLTYVTFLHLAGSIVEKRLIVNICVFCFLVNFVFVCSGKRAMWHRQPSSTKEMLFLHNLQVFFRASFQLCLFNDLFWHLLLLNTEHAV